MYKPEVLLEAKNVGIFGEALDQYVGNVYRFLRTMKANTRITLKNHVKDVNLKLYIEIVKMYMDDTPSKQCGILFSNDYSVLKKYY